MQLTPRYGSNPVLHLDGDPTAIGELMVRQQQRFATALAALSATQWEQASRCEGWSSKNVVEHLAAANAYWELSIRSGIAGQPTEIMAAFDPVVTPRQMVADSASRPDEVSDAMVASSESLAACLRELTPSDWAVLAESPPGHVTVSTVVHHAFWDSWIHERDVLIPLGLVPVEEPDEVLAGLRYIAGFTPALVLNSGGTDAGAFDVSVTDVDADFHVEIDHDVRVSAGATGADFVLEGSGVELLEALSFRRPLDQHVPEAIRWAFAGLGAAYDRS